MAGLATIAAPLPKRPARAPSLIDRKLKTRPSRIGLGMFAGAVVAALGYIVFHVSRDLDAVKATSVWPYMLLGLALAIALGFEFVNGFHDTANAVATVIYTNSLEPHVAVAWSGLCNLAGVLASSGTVAFAIVTLLPVDLILQVSSGAGFAMVFALLIAAILWNLGTWWLGLPASSSHTMVGSIVGVGLANKFLNPHTGTSGVDWEQGMKVLKALLFSPLIGFTVAALLLLLSRWLLRYPLLYRAPETNDPPPFPIRLLMVCTCTGVSFYHGSNDGQKGMGLIMLILIGTVPTAYALNHAVSPAQVQDFIAASEKAEHILDRYVPPETVQVPNARAEVTDYVRTSHMTPATVPALRDLVKQLDQEVSLYGGYKAVPDKEQANVRNNMYVASEALRLMDKQHNPHFAAEDWAGLNNYKSKVDKSISRSASLATYMWFRTRSRLTSATTCTWPARRSG